MDKGLKLINELEEMLTDLETKKENQERELKKNQNDFVYIEKENMGLKTYLIGLEYAKKSMEEGPKEKKQQKKIIKKLLALAVFLVSVLAFVVFGVQILCGAELIYALSTAVATLGICVVSVGITGAIVTSIINKPIECNKSLEEIVADMDQTNAELQDNKIRQVELNKSIAKLKKVIQELKQEIAKVKEKIDNIKALRKEAISDFCKDNPMIDELLNEAYDQKIGGAIIIDEMPKQKVNSNK